MNNLGADMIRQPPGIAQPAMMGLGGPFMQNAPPSGPPQPPMGSTGPPMGMLGPPSQAHAMANQRYQMQQPSHQPHQQGGPQRQAMMMGRGMNAPGGGGSHMGMALPPAHMMHHSASSLAARRGVSQGHLNPGAPHMGGGQQVGQMRQAPPQTLPGAPMRSVSSGHLSPEMGMGMARQGGTAMPQNIARSGSAPMPLMANGISPPNLGQPSAHQPNFQSLQSPALHAMQHQTSQMAPSPRPSSHPSAQPQNMNMGPGPSNAAMRPSADPPMDFIAFPSQSFPSQPASNASSQFPFVPSSSTPPNQIAPMSRSIAPNLGNAPPTRSGFQLTPAQQFAEMQQQGSENYNFSMPPPQRPPSHNPHSTPLQPPQPQPHPHSPRAPDNMNNYPPQQQPHSRPQSTTGRPPSSHDHRVGPQHQLPPNSGPSAGRLQPHHSGPQQPQSSLPPPPPPPSSAHPVQPNPPRPPNQTSAAYGHVGSPASSSTMSSSEQQASTSAPRGIMPPQPQSAVPLVGNGQGLMRLLQFSGNLSSETKTKLQLSWWNELIKEYFTPKAIMKITLWKDNQKAEAKPFEIGVPILPRFFLVTTQSGVKSMTLSLDGARERVYGQGHSVVECVAAVWTYRYINGYTVTLRGPLTAHVVITSPHPPGSAAAHQGYVLRFEDFQFDANYHDKYISLDSIIMAPKTESPKTPRTRTTPAPGASNGIQSQGDDDKAYEEPRMTIDRGSIPGEPVNAFGIPQATMRCLELAESVAQMTDLIGFASETNLGPLEALTHYASKLRETHTLPPNAGHMMNGIGHAPNSMLPYHYSPYHTHTGSTLFTSAPQSVINAGGHHPSSHPHLHPQSSSGPLHSPQTHPPSAHSSPQKAHKTIPQHPQHPQQNAPSTASSSTPTSTVNTPALSHTTLKRKQPVDSTSPSITDAAPPTKRPTRKRRTTGTG